MSADFFEKLQPSDTENLEHGGALAQIFVLFSLMEKSRADVRDLDNDTLSVLRGFQKELAKLPMRLAEVLRPRNLDSDSFGNHHRMLNSDNEISIILNARIDERGAFVIFWQPKDLNDFPNFSASQFQGIRKANELVHVEGFLKILPGAQPGAQPVQGLLPETTTSVARGHLAVVSVMMFHDLELLLSEYYAVDSTPPCVELNGDGAILSWNVNEALVSGPRAG